MHAKDVVLAFWDTMGTNDFHQASAWVTADFECLWPQSAERIVGRHNFAELNAHYPATGRWLFHLNAIVAEDDQVVTDVSITDGVQQARAITFHTVRDGLICKQVEFWPDPYPAPAWRAQWVERVTSA